MAIQTGPFPLSGRFGNAVFYTARGKHFVRQAPASVKQSENTRKSGTDFGSNNTAVRMMNAAFRPMMGKLAYAHFYHRLNRKMLKVLHSIPKEQLGIRKIAEGDLSLLVGFEFNRFKSVIGLAFFSPAIEINLAGDTVISVPPLHPGKAFKAHKDAATVVIRFRCCVFRFEDEDGAYRQPADLIIPLHQTVFPGGRIRIPMEGAEDCACIIGFTVHFLTKEHTEIHDREYYGGCFLTAINIMDGQIIPYTPPPAVSKPIPPPAANEIQWEINNET